MITRNISNGLKMLRRSWAFSTAEKKAARPAYLTPEAIKETLKPEEYDNIAKIVEKTEQEWETNHQERLKKVSSRLSDDDKSRISKIAKLLSSLNEQEAEYVKWRLMETAEIRLNK